MICTRESRIGMPWRFVLAVLGVVLALALTPPGIATAQTARTYPRPTGYVNDHADVLSPEVKERLEGLLTRIDQELGVQFAIVSTRDLGDEDPTEYANRLFEVWKVGNKKTDRGILLLDAVGDAPGRSFFRVEVGYGLEGVLPDGRVGAILDQDVVPYLKQDRRDLAYVSAVRELTRPILREMGRDPATIDSLLTQGGYRVRRGHTAAPQGFRLLITVVLIIIMMLSGLNRRRRGGIFFGGFPGGGFGGFGGGGGGGFGGFGGFGGGGSGGGGAGRGY
jgi:uncharacterized protein